MGARQRTWLAFERRTALSGWIIDGGGGGAASPKAAVPAPGGRRKLFHLPGAEPPSAAQRRSPSPSPHFSGLGSGRTWTAVLSQEVRSPLKCVSLTRAQKLTWVRGSAFVGAASVDVGPEWSRSRPPLEARKGPAAVPLAV